MKTANNGASVLDMAHCDKKPLYAIFTRDKELILRGAEDNSARSLARLDNIAEMDIKLYCHHPYICVSERYGLNAVVVNMESGDIKIFRRDDYHADVFTFSIGFADRGGRTLLIHQTQWNRLDITDLQTGERLTDHEIVCRQIAEGYNDENGEWVEAKYKSKNYLDYFHSLLHVSPKGNWFLSCGWLWAPCEKVLYFNLDKFLQGYEPTMTAFSYNGGGYNWDRPCAFIEDDIVVIATDDFKQDLEEEGEYADIYRSLLFFRLETNESRQTEEWNYLEPFRVVRCDVFIPYEYGEIHGDLYYDAAFGYLIAMTERGAFGVNLEGVTLWHEPELIAHNGWKYSADFHLFYHYNETTGKIDQRSISQVNPP